MLGADCERMRRRTTPSVSRCRSRALFVSVVLMALIFSSLVEALDSVVVGAMDTNTLVVCNGAASMGGGSTSGGGTLLSVPMQSGVTYLLVDCVVPLLQVELISVGTAAPLLENVTIVSRGGSVLPSILVNATTVNNLFVDMADVHSSAIPTVARRVTWNIVDLDQVAVATNITVTLTRVHIENALNMTLVRIDASTKLDGLDITLVNCTLRNVTTTGLVTVSGNFDTTTVESLNVTLSGGLYELVLLREGSCPVIGFTDLHSLSNVAVAARGGVSMDIQNALTEGTGVGMTVLMDCSGINVASHVHVVIDGMTANVSLDDPAGTLMSIVETAFVYTSLTYCSVTVKDSRFFVRAGAVHIVSLRDMPIVQDVEILLERTPVELVVDKAARTGENVLASTMYASKIGLLNHCNVVITACDLTIHARNGSVLQDYFSVACAPILWFYVSNTTSSSITVVRSMITITARETSICMVLSPLLPAVGMLSLTASAFSSTQGSFQNTTLVVEDVDLICDVVVIPPVVPVVGPTAPSSMRAAFVTIAFVSSNSNWTNSSISVQSSRVMVQQLQFLVSPGDVISNGESNDWSCNTVVLVKSMALISFRSAMQYFDACVPQPIFKTLLGSQYSLSFILRDVTLSADNCVLVVGFTSAEYVPATSSLWPLFVSGMYLPPALSSSRISLANVSASGLPSMRTGPVIALSGTTAVSLDAHVSQVNGFQLGVVSSTASAASTLWSTHIHATEVDSAGALLEGNVSVATLFTATLRSCSFGHRLLLGAGAGVSSVCPSRPSAPAAVAVVLQGCNKWNGRPLTPALTRRLLKESQCPAALGTVSIRAEDTCVATATLVPVVPLTVARVSTATVVVAVSALAMSAVGAASVGSITSSVRMQTALGALRVGRRCALLQSDDAVDSNDNDVGSAPFDNPLQLSLPVEDTRLTFAAGCVLGNTLLFIVAAVALNVPMDALSRTTWMRSKLWSTLSTVICRHVAAVVPGNAIVVIMLLLPPTVASCAALTGAAAAHIGTAVSGAVCALVFAVGPVVSVGLLLWVFPLQAAAVVAARKPALGNASAITTAVATWLFQEPSKWVPISSAAASSSSSPRRLDALAFRRRFGVLFAGYRGGCHWYAAVDVVVPVVSAVLSGLPPSEDSGGSLPATCSWVLYALLAFFIVPCVGAVAFRPCMTRWDNLWAIVSNGLSLAVVVALVVAGSDPDLANSLTAALAWISLVPAVTAVVRLIAVAWLKLRGSSQEQEGNSDFVNDNMKVKKRIGHRPPLSASVAARSSLDKLLLHLSSNRETATPNESLALLVRFICSK